MAWIVFTYIGLIGCMAAFGGTMGVERWAYWTFMAIVSFASAFGIIYGVANIRAKGFFSCRIDHGGIKCHCPVASCGDSFHIAVDDLAKIEKERWSESHRWFLWDVNGQRWWLTSNYDNPADQFIDIVRQLRPDLRETTT